MHLACGVAVGMTGLAAGYCIGIVGDTGVRAYMEQSRIFVGMVLILIFGEVLGLYGSVSTLGAAGVNAAANGPAASSLPCSSTREARAECPTRPRITAKRTMRHAQRGKEYALRAGLRCSRWGREHTSQARELS